MTDFKSLLAIIACSIMLFACGGAKAPEDVATEFITNIYNAKTDYAVAMLYLDEEKEADEKDMGYFIAYNLRVLELAFVEQGQRATQAMIPVAWPEWLA